MGCGASVDDPPPAERRAPRAAPAPPRNRVVAGGGAGAGLRQLRAVPRNNAAPPKVESKAVARFIGTSVTENPHIYVIGGPRSFTSSWPERKTKLFSVFPIDRDYQPSVNELTPSPPFVLHGFAALDVQLPFPMRRSKAVMGEKPQATHIDAASRTRFRNTVNNVKGRIFVYCRGTPVPHAEFPMPLNGRISFGQLREKIKKSELFMFEKFTFRSCRSSLESKRLVPRGVWPPSLEHWFVTQRAPLADNDATVVICPFSNGLATCEQIVLQWFEAANDKALNAMEVLFRGCPAIAHSRDHGCRTALHVAVEESQGDGAFAREVLRLGVALDARDQCGQTVLHIAARLGESDVLQLLLEHCMVLGDADRISQFVNCATTDGWTALHIAYVYAQKARNRGNIERYALYLKIAEALIKKGADPWIAQCRTLHNGHNLALATYMSVFDAAVEHDPGRLERLATLNCSVEERLATQNLTLVDGCSNTVGLTPRGSYCINETGITVLHQTVAQGSDSELLGLLLQPSPIVDNAGGQLSWSTHPLLAPLVDLPNSNGEHAAFLAVRHGDTRALNQLLKAGAAIYSARSRSNRNIFHYCLGSRKGTQCLVVLLSDPNVRTGLLNEPDDTLVTPLELAFAPSRKLAESQLIHLCRLVGNTLAAAPTLPANVIKQSNSSTIPSLSSQQYNRTGKWGRPFKFHLDRLRARQAELPALHVTLLGLACTFGYLDVVSWFMKNVPVVALGPRDTWCHPLLKIADGRQESKPSELLNLIRPTLSFLPSQLPDGRESVAVFLQDMLYNNNGERWSDVKFWYRLCEENLFLPTIRRWCLSPSCQLSPHGMSPLRSSHFRSPLVPLWRRFGYASFGLISSVSCRPMFDFLRFLLEPNGEEPVVLTTVEEKRLVAATALKYLLFCDTMFNKAASLAAIDRCISSLALSDEQRKERISLLEEPAAESHDEGVLKLPRSSTLAAPLSMAFRSSLRRPVGLPVISCGTPIRPKVSEPSTIVELALSAMLWRAQVLPDDKAEWLDTAAYWGVHSVCSRIINECPSTPSLQLRARYLCLVDTSPASLQTIAEARQRGWWSWGVVLHAVQYGCVLRTTHKTRQYPSAEVLDAVASQLPTQAIEPLSFSQLSACVFRWCRSSVRPGAWMYQLMKTLLTTGNGSKYSFQLAMCASQRYDVNLLRSLPQSLIRIVLRRAIVVDNAQVVGRYVTGIEDYARYSADFPEPLLHFCCTQRAIQCLQLMLKHVERSHCLIPGAHGLNAWDICVALHWREGLDHFRAIHEGKQLIALQKSTSAEVAELFRLAYEPSIATFAYLGQTREIRNKACSFDSCHVFLKCIAAVQKQDIVSIWVANCPPLKKNKAVLGEGLHIAIRRNHSQRVVRALLQEGAPTNWRVAPQSPTALHLAVRRREAIVVDMLLSAGADPNAAQQVEVEDNTTLSILPLHEAYALRDKTIVELLAPRTAFPPAMCFGSWDVRLWYLAFKEVHDQFRTYQETSPDFPQENFGACLFFAPTVAGSGDRLHFPRMLFPPPGEFRIRAVDDHSGSVKRGPSSVPEATASLSNDSPPAWDHRLRSVEFWSIGPKGLSSLSQLPSELVRSANKAPSAESEGKKANERRLPSGDENRNPAHV